MSHAWCVDRGAFVASVCGYQDTISNYRRNEVKMDNTASLVVAEDGLASRDGMANSGRAGTASVVKPASCASKTALMRAITTPLAINISRMEAVRFGMVTRLCKYVSIVVAIMM